MKYLVLSTGVLVANKVTASYQTATNNFQGYAYDVDTPSISVTWNNSNWFVIRNTLPFATRLYRPFMRFMPDARFKDCWKTITTVYVDYHTSSSATAFDKAAGTSTAAFNDIPSAYYMDIPNLNRITTSSTNTTVYTVDDGNGNYINKFTVGIPSTIYPTMPNNMTLTYFANCRVLLDLVYVFDDNDPNYDALKALYPDHTKDVDANWIPTDYDWVMTSGTLPKQAGWKYYSNTHIYIGDEAVDAVYRGNTLLTDIYVGNTKI